MLTNLWTWLAGILIEKVGAYLLNLIGKKKHDKDITDKEMSVARTINLITSEIYALEDILEGEPREAEREKIKSQIRKLEDELRVSTRYQSY